MPIHAWTRVPAGTFHFFHRRGSQDAADGIVAAARGDDAMQTIRALEKTGKDGMLSLHVPLGEPETEYEVLVVVQPKIPAATPDERGWPPGYFDLAGSIDDETFVRPPQGELPPPVELG